MDEMEKLMGEYPIDDDIKDVIATFVVFTLHDVEGHKIEARTSRKRILPTSYQSEEISTVQ